MAILYKRFVSTRTVFYVALACFFMVLAQARAQEGDLFTVENVKVDVTAASALAARDQAFDAAQVQAFETLAARMLPEGEMATFKAPDLSIISPMIQDYEITQEKLSSVRYVGTYTFRFKDAAVRKYFSVSGVPFADISSKPVLVLPFLQQDGRALIWSPYNTWMQAWNRSAANSGLVPVVVPIGELQDVKDIGEDQALNYHESGLANMLNRYEAGDAVVVLAVPDTTLAKIRQDEVTAMGSLAIDIYRTDHDGPELVQTLTVTPLQNQTRGQLFDEAVKRVHAVLQSDWKTRTAVQPVPQEQGNVLKVQVTFNNLQEWSQIRSSLSRVSAIQDMTLRSLSPKSAFIDLMFQGTQDRLRLALEQVDMTLSAPQIQPGIASYGYDNPPLYTLTRNRRMDTMDMPRTGGIPSRVPQPYTGQF